MNLNLISTFVRVVEAGSFSGAASALGLPKSSVSRAVTQLEDDLGVRLLHRTTRKLSLTEAGARYFDEVRGALAGLEDAGTVASDQAREPRGVVRITAPVDLGHGVLAEVMARFLARHPGVEIDLSLTNRRVDLVREGFDLALRGGPMSDSSLMARKVGDTDLGLFASPDYLARRGRPLTIAALEGHHAVLMRGALGPLAWGLTGPGRARVPPMRTRLVVDDFSFVRRAISAGVGIGLLPAWRWPGGGDDKEWERLVRLLPKHAVRGGSLSVLWPSGRHVPVRVALLRDHLIDELGKGRQMCEEAIAAHAAGRAKKTR